MLLLATHVLLTAVATAQPDVVITTRVHVPQPSVPLFRVVERRFQFAESSDAAGGGTFNAWAVVGCEATVAPPAHSRHGNMSIALFFDGDVSGAPASASTKPSSNARAFAFRFVPDVAGYWRWSLHCPQLTLVTGQDTYGVVEAVRVAVSCVCACVCVCIYSCHVSTGRTTPPR